MIKKITFDYDFDSNCALFQEKQSFIKANKKDDEDTLSADKMSEFYKAFLDNNWKVHFNYNREW